jgi:hypothetical protein
MRRNLLLAGLLAAVSALPAQQNIKWLDDALPSGIANAFPWGSAGVRYQAIVPGALLGGGGLIQDLFVAGRPGGADLEIVYSDIEIRMGLTAQSLPQPDWDANNPSPTVVHRGPLRVHLQSGAWRGVGLPQPYRFAPQPGTPNLCLEIIVRRVAGQDVGSNFYYPLASRTLARAFAHDWISEPGKAPTVESGSGSKLGILLDDGNFVAIGAGCAGSNGLAPRIGVPAGAWPQLGGTLSITLQRALPKTSAALAIGASSSNWQALSLPYDLAPLGAGGCLVWNDPTVLLGASVDAQGNAALPLAVPADPALHGGRAFAFWIVLDGDANALGAITSGGSALLVGT